ncbi:hypothetical protein [Geomonas ferrireducens]|uniref:hypothetical protein n=1 Tax=Geomonas ferrireducens TaxID=2570227 RepID=UPI0010A758AC|nr:hypothetical protein [Geomonas ferrireducens]
MHSGVAEQEHELIEKLEAYAKKEHRKYLLLKEAMEEILTVGLRTRLRNTMINTACYALIESEDGFEEMSPEEQDRMRRAIIAKAQGRK